MNKQELIQSYLEREMLLSFNHEQEYLDFINHERVCNWLDIYPNTFETLEQAKMLADKYQIEHEGNVYFALFDDVANALK